MHYGHLHHIAETKRLMGEDCPVVCVMSGDFIQRGEAAVYSKFARAEAAVMSGVDLVLELPLPWVLSSAEGFARGAVGLLGELRQRVRRDRGDRNDSRNAYRSAHRRRYPR